MDVSAGIGTCLPESREEHGSTAECSRGHVTYRGKPIGTDAGLQLWSKMDQYFKDEEGLADSTRQRYRGTALRFIKKGVTSFGAAEDASKALENGGDRNLIKVLAAMGRYFRHARDKEGEEEGDRKRPMDASDTAGHAGNSLMDNAVTHPFEKEGGTRCASLGKRRKTEELVSLVVNVGADAIRTSFFLGHSGGSDAVAVDGGHPCLSLGVCIEMLENGEPAPKPGRLTSFQCVFSRDGKGSLKCSGITPDYVYSHVLALTCVRSRLNKIRSLVGSKEQTDFMKVLISTHMAPRAMHKTGGSAGAMMVASFLALATGLSVKRRTVFTGEVDYRGLVHGIGSIVEKARGAKAAGATTLICPEENAKELKALQKPIEGLTVHGVSDLRGILRYGLEHTKTDIDWDAPESDLEPLDEGAFLGRAYALTYLIGPAQQQADGTPQQQAHGTPQQQAHGTAVESGGKLKVQGFIQEVQVMAISGGVGRVVGMNLKHQIDEPCHDALDWLAEEADTIGLTAHQRKGMDCRRLSQDYDTFGYLPSDQERQETHLASAVFLAAVSMVTGWQMDPTVLIVGDVDMSGNMLPFHGMSVLEVQVAYSLPSLRHLIVPAPMVDRFRELDKRIVMGEGWVPLTYHGAVNIKDVLHIAFPEARRHMSPDQILLPPRAEELERGEESDSSRDSQDGQLEEGRKEQGKGEEGQMAEGSTSSGGKQDQQVAEEQQGAAGKGERRIGEGDKAEDGHQDDYERPSTASQPSAP